jgi:carboxypeptidase Taq
MRIAMQDSMQQLNSQFIRLSRLEHAITFLQWDHMVMMPPGGASSRGEAIAELTALHHQLLTSAMTGELLNKASAENAPENRQSLLEMKRKYDQAVCLPDELVKAKSLAGSRCEHGWRTQRNDNDWEGFLTNFREVVSLSRQEAQARQEAGDKKLPTPYDAMLELYCTGDSSQFIAGIFTVLKEQLPPLLDRIGEFQKTVSFTSLSGHFPEENQKKLCRSLAASLGFNFKHGRIDVSSHPFSTGCRGDQRITTRYRESDFIEALLATAHETGHASYENGLPEKWDGLPVGEARNLCIHESQSLFFEKQLFLSLPFLDFFTPEIRNHLNLGRDFNADLLWSAATRVQPSYIRIEADEVTYPLHIIIRYEIESGLINGSLRPEDIPEFWDAGMRSYLGLSTAGNHRDGCLQDMHWSDGSFGYFPSYTIGAINSAQLAQAIRTAHPQWRENLAGGDITFVCDWLSSRIWSKGSSLLSQEIMVAATGQETNPESLIRHLEDRYLKRLY